MKVYVSTTIIGALAFDSEGNLVAKRLFEKDANKIVERFEKALGGEIIEEELSLLKELEEKGYEEIFIRKKLENFEIKSNVKLDIEDKGKEFARNYRKIALENKWVLNESELNQLLTKIGVKLAGQKIKSVGRDKIIIQVIGIIDDLDEDINSLSERLREWYGIHFPELSKEIKSHESYALLVSKYGKRDNIKEDKVRQIALASTGADFSEKDEESVKLYSKMILEMFKTREVLYKYLEDLCKEVIPNLSAVAGSAIASRLISHAGGLEKIAKMPSSTIQLLGAEKALFRHLKGKGKAPKYGVIYAHPFIQKAPKEMRGKVARLIASKLSLAAKMDFYSKKDKGEELRKDLEKEIEEVLKIRP